MSPAVPLLCRTVLPGVAVLLSLPGSASAFCRQTTCDTADCPIDSRGCIAEGNDLYYDVPCLSFAVDEGSGQALGISDDEMIDIVAEAFETWRSVECPGGGQPNFEVQAAGLVDAKGIFFCEEEESNVSVWTFDSSWNYEPSSLGYTTSTFVVDTGEVYDADVELNLRRIAGVIPPEGDVRRAVLSVVTHEAGHFLGLAHSDDTGAVMAATYADLDPRPLTEDDIAGICAIYPPDDGGLGCSDPGTSEAGYEAAACDELTGNDSEAEGSCSVAAPGLSGKPWGALLFAAMTLAFTHRRRRQASRVSRWTSSHSA